MTIAIETQERFIELRSKGMSFDKISKELEVSKPTLLKWQVEFDSPISEARYFELQGIIEKFSLMRLARIEAFSEVLGGCLSELRSRAAQLSEVPIDKLLAMTLTVEQRLSSELQGSKYIVPGSTLDLASLFGGASRIDID